MDNIDKKNFIIKSPEQLKDPFLCYCLIRRYMIEAGEDFLDYNIDIDYDCRESFVKWLVEKNHIKNDESIISQFSTCLDVFESSDIFPYVDDCGCRDYKFYSLLAEFMSTSENTRKMLYDSAYSDGSFYGGFYKNENGVSLACFVSADDMALKVDAKKDEPCEMWNMSLRDEWNLLTSMTISECVKYDEKLNERHRSGR